MNLSELLEPISEDARCGSDLSLSSAFDAIRELRREDDASLDQGEWVQPLKTADWAAVRQQCEVLLREQTKDLRLAAWWLEASAQLDGLRGLAAGLALTLALVRQEWQDLHPQMADGDSDERVGALSWLLARVVALAGHAPVLQVGRHALGLLALDQLRLGKAPDGAAAEGLPQWPQALRKLVDQGHGPQRERQQALAEARRDLAALATELDARLGHDGPAITAASRALTEAEDRLHRCAREAGLDSARETPLHDAEGDAAERTDVAPAAGGSSALRAGSLQSREQALQQLRAVAAFFRRTEPHSPVAYVADKAVRWAEMPLHAWLRDVVKDGGTLDRLDELLGLPPPAGG